MEGSASWAAVSEAFTRATTQPVTVPYKSGSGRGWGGQIQRAESAEERRRTAEIEGLGAQGQMPWIFHKKKGKERRGKKGGKCYGKCSKSKPNHRQKKTDQLHRIKITDQHAGSWDTK